MNMRKTVSISLLIALVPAAAMYYFVVLNLACILSCWKFLNWQKMVLWNPRKAAGLVIHTLCLYKA